MELDLNVRVFPDLFHLFLDGLYHGIKHADQDVHLLVGGAPEGDFPIIFHMGQAVSLDGGGKFLNRIYNRAGQQKRVNYVSSDH